MDAAALLLATRRQLWVVVQLVSCKVQLAVCKNKSEVLFIAAAVPMAVRFEVSCVTFELRMPQWRHLAVLWVSRMAPDMALSLPHVAGSIVWGANPPLTCSAELGAMTTG